MSRLRNFCLVAIMAVCSCTGIQAADLIYSMTGGTLSGTLNGVPFANAGYSITATADPALIQSYTILGAVPADYLLATGLQRKIQPRQRKGRRNGRSVDRSEMRHCR